MSGVTKFLASNSFLNSMEDHKNSHIVIDGANLQYRSYGSHSTNLSDFYASYAMIKSFLESFLKRGIIPHVIFDGSNNGDPKKWERSIARRNERLQRIVALDEQQQSSLLNSTTNLEIFKNVVEDLKIEAFQAGVEQDFTYEMAAYANYLKGPVLSNSGKLFLMNISKGFIHFDDAAFEGAVARKPFKTFSFAKLKEFIDIKYSRNQSALSMWSAVLYNRNTFGDFTEYFFKKNVRFPFPYRQSHNRWMKDLSGGNFIRGQFKILDFLMQHPESDCRRMIGQCLSLSNRTTAELIFDQMLAFVDNEPQNLPSKLELYLSRRSEELSIPLQFLKATSFDTKLLPGFLDLIIDRKFHTSVNLENFKRESSNDSVKTLRRIVYAILLTDKVPRGAIEEKIVVQELNRVGRNLVLSDVEPLWSLWSDDEDESKPFPGLYEIENLEQPERQLIFLKALRMKETPEIVDCLRKGNGYPVIVFKHWCDSAIKLTRSEVATMLISLLISAKHHSYELPFFLFGKVELKENFDTLLFTETPSFFLTEMKYLHPSTQLLSTVFLCRSLHRILLQPLGEKDCLEHYFNEIVFHNVAKHLDKNRKNSLEDLLDDIMDKDSQKLFQRTLDFYMNEKDRAFVKRFEILLRFAGEESAVEGSGNDSEDSI